MILTRQALDRFLQNTCSEQEAEYVRQYLSRNPEIAKVLLEKEGPEVYEGRELEESVSNRMKLFIHQQTVHRARVRRLVRMAGAVAASLLIIVAGMFWYRTANNASPVNIAGNIVKGNPLFYQNQTNTTKTVWLADSTRVLLYSNATLQLDTVYNQKDRRIEMTGEADFFVAHNKQKPFVVKSGAYTTTALGTAFKVVSGNAHKAMTVRLFNGKVKIEHIDSLGKKLLAVLNPGEEVMVQDGFATVKNRKIIPEIKKRTQSSVPNGGSIVATRGGFSVVKMALPLVLMKLEKEYHASIQFNERELAGISVTATFSSKETITSILEQITLLNNLNLSKNETTYFITKE
ncbi:FecR domain-containing protein [Danxiaibacter flavus]|uniref:FecR domain-containing protein n=1 Tax=Danxiaibacter flavus TaxID=3049108 RepID=A0ABV3ZL16_9BACT|nr:FecR domain-containing protein [Chitinophagaceae bacterium DXS]